MLDKVLIGAVVWLASNKTGRRVARKGYKALSRLGDYAVKSMPDEVSSIFSVTEKFVKSMTSDKPVSGAEQEG